MKNTGSKRIAERYVKALFDVASAAGSLAVVEKDLASLNAALAGSPELQDFTQNPLLSREQKAAAMKAILAKMQANELTVKFITTLASQKRLDVLSDVASLFATWAQASRGEMSAKIVTATALSDKDAKDVAAKLEKAYGKKINLQVQEDASLLGGAVVHIGSIQLDSSLSGKLSRLKQKLQAA